MEVVGLDSMTLILGFHRDNRENHRIEMKNKFERVRFLACEVEEKIIIMLVGHCLGGGLCGI